MKRRLFCFSCLLFPCLIGLSGCTLPWERLEQSPAPTSYPVIAGYELGYQVSYTENRSTGNNLLQVVLTNQGSSTVGVALSPGLFTGTVQVLDDSGTLLFEARQKQYREIMLSAAFVIPPKELAVGESLSWEIHLNELVISRSFEDALPSDQAAQASKPSGLRLSPELIEGKQLLSELKFELVRSNGDSISSKAITLHSSPLSIQKSP